jgi:hypothetical protein
MREQKMAWINETGIPNEWKWERARLYRDDLLKASDWRMVEDAVWDKSVWATYREALRNLPNTMADSAEIVFPTEPGSN